MYLSSFRQYIDRLGYEGVEIRYKGLTYTSVRKLPTRGSSIIRIETPSDRITGRAVWYRSVNPIKFWDGDSGVFHYTKVYESSVIPGGCYVVRV